LPNWGGHRQQTDENRLAWLSSYWRSEKTSQRTARGFKFQFDISKPQFNELAALGRTLQRANAVVVRLRRDDRVRHAISVLRARALQKLNQRVGNNNGAHIYSNAPTEVRHFADQAIRIDITQFELVLRNIAINADYMDSFMDRVGVDVDVTYESYLSNRLGVLNGIAQAVGTDPFLTAPPQTITKNTSNDLSRAVSNIDDVEAAALRAGLAID
jgi:LPS sulfotransferase NodH